jgi:hypothetical protein
VISIINFGRSLSLSLFPVAPIWSRGHPSNASFHFSFLIRRQSVGLLGWASSPSQGRYLHKHRIKADRHPWLSGIRTHNPSVRAREDSALADTSTFLSEVNERQRLGCTQTCKGRSCGVRTQHRSKRSTLIYWLLTRRILHYVRLMI